MYTKEIDKESNADKVNNKDSKGNEVQLDTKKDIKTNSTSFNEVLS